MLGIGSVCKSTTAAIVSPYPLGRAAKLLARKQAVAALVLAITLLESALEAPDWFSGPDGKRIARAGGQSTNGVSSSLRSGGC